MCAGAPVARFAVIIDLWRRGYHSLSPPTQHLRATLSSQRCQVTSAFAVCRWTPLWRPSASRMARRMHPTNIELVDGASGRLHYVRDCSAARTPAAVAGRLAGQPVVMSRWTCSTCCWGDRGRAERWLRCPRPRWCESSATTRRRFSMSRIAELHFLLPRTNGERELAAPTPSASFHGGISQLVLHVENGILETFLLMCGTSAPARDYEHARCERCCAAAAAAGLLLLLLLVVVNPHSTRGKVVPTWAK